MPFFAKPVPRTKKCSTPKEVIGAGYKLLSVNCRSSEPLLLPLIARPNEDGGKVGLREIKICKKWKN